MIFHPLTGLCVLRESIYKPLKLGTCNKSEAWKYLPQRTLKLKGTDFCIEAFRLGEPAMLGYTCALSSYQWETISDSKMHLSSKVFNGSRACLDVDSENTVVVNSCKCLSRDNMCDPGSQWFKLVDSTNSSYTSPALELDTAFAYPYRCKYFVYMEVVEISFKPQMFFNNPRHVHKIRSLIRISDLNQPKIIERGLKFTIRPCDNSILLGFRLLAKLSLVCIISSQEVESQKNQFLEDPHLTFDQPKLKLEVQKTFTQPKLPKQ